MASYFRFSSAVLRRAWQIAWAMVIERSIRALVRDLIILIIALFSLREMHGYLEKLNALPQHDNLLAETLIWVSLVASATVIIFACDIYFLCALYCPVSTISRTGEKPRCLFARRNGKVRKAIAAN
jgi:hypothetical protein